MKMTLPIVRVAVSILVFTLMAMGSQATAHAEQVNAAAPVQSASPALPASLSEMPNYYYDAGGRKMIQTGESEFVVRTVPTPGHAEPNRRPASLPDVAIPQTLAVSAAKLERSMAQRGMHVVRGAAADTLTANNDVTDVLPICYRVGSNFPMYPCNRVVLRLKPGTDVAQINALAQHYGFQVEKRSRGQDRYLLTVPDVDAVNPIALANFLHERNDLTEYAEPDFFLPKVTHSPLPIDDPFYLSLQWHLDGDVSKGAAPNSDLNMEAAWDSIYGGTALGSPTVRVSILDECVEKLHPDLFPNWADGLDLDPVPPDDDPSPDAGQRHGTACAGLAVAAANNIGVRGTAPACGLIGVKFFGATISEMSEGFYFSMDPDDNGDHSDGAAVLSNSWSFSDGTLLPSDVVNAINTVATTGRNGLGCLVLFASGNNDHTVNGVTALAQLDSTMAVGGTNSNNMHTEFSDVGPEVGIVTPTNDRGDDDVRFPWLDITSVDNTGPSGYNGIAGDDNYTDEFGGTSSSTPEAAGLFALVISQDENNMTAAQARAILQHTAVRIEEPYGRFDGITGHSHRFGYGRADGGLAMAAAAGGVRWPDRIDKLTITPAGDDLILGWDTPPNDYAGSIVVRSDVPFAWMPTDGVTYSVSQVVSPGVTVVYDGLTPTHTDVDAIQGGFFYGVYPYSAAARYGFGAKGHRIRGSTSLFYDNSEGPIPGWTHGGSGDEWNRGLPTSFVSTFLGQFVGGSGPLAGLNSTRAISGDRCWGTDLSSTYNAFADAWLDTPLINLTGVTDPVFLEYFDWSMLETFYDTFTVEVVDKNGAFLGYIDDDTGGDYDWSQKAYDLSAFAGQAIKIRFHIQTDETIQRDGWFIDEVRVSVATLGNLPPVATDVEVETNTNSNAIAQFFATDPNVGTVLSFVVTSLPQHAQLIDPFDSTMINSVPYTVKNNGFVVVIDPELNYEGPDAFTYEASDGSLPSNTADVSLSIGTPIVAYDFPLNVDPDWLTEGDWQFGVPQGLAGDPAAAFTGSNVLGYNLAGAYTDDLPPQHLTTLPLNCTGLTRVTLEFARWLGVEAASFDSANIEVTTNGVNWTPIYTHTGTTDLVETSWSHQSHKAKIADNQPFVQFRWTMGPTDSGVTFAGWNIDDVQVLGIGAASANQPPFAYSQFTETAKNIDLPITLDAIDVDSDGLNFEIVSLPASGTLVDPGSGPIGAVPHVLSGGGNSVTYEPDIDFASNDSFTFRTNDGALDSNVATVDIRVIDPAPFPFTDDFETGPPLDNAWIAESTGPGRIDVVNTFGPQESFHVILDSGASSTFALNELTLAVDLLGASQVLLKYDWKEFNEEANALPASWTGSFEGDGVAISDDGVTWHRIASLHTALANNTYETVVIDLDQAAADAGLVYNHTFRIRFQQYDNNPADVDGIALDNIGVLQGTDDPLIATAILPPALVGVPYGPHAVTAVGGDAPLIWSTPTIFSETNIGSNALSTNGVAQGWIGDDVTFDYTLPFAFPFYGESLTDVKIAIDGFINFGTYVGSTHNNSDILLQANKRIAVLWDDQETTLDGDVYIDESVADQVAIRWETLDGPNPLNYSATLYADGAIRFDYGAGNTSLSPTIGVSAGGVTQFYMASYNNATNLGDADSLLLDFGKLPPGLSADMDGVVSGTPTTAGMFQPVFHVEDASMRTDQTAVTLEVNQPAFGDWDADGDIDDEDYAGFAGCTDNPSPDAMCLAIFDDNENGVVDLEDFARFQHDYVTGIVPQ